jgi:hypothetical protein
MIDFRQPQLTQVTELTSIGRLRDRLQVAIAHPGTVTELMGARLRFDDRLQAATAHPGTVTELMRKGCVLMTDFR